MTFRITRLVAPPGYEAVLRADDPSIGYTGFIAVHSTALGPAIGGTRYWKYASDAEALADVLKLARAMTCKSALAGLPFGGGKSVIVRRGDYVDRSAIFRAHGRFVQVLDGAYITAQDVGTSPADMLQMLSETRHVAGLPGESGDPAPHTARGVFSALLAASAHRWGEAAVSRRTVAIQGCGAVGRQLALELHRAGASLVVCDTEGSLARRLAEGTGATVVAPEAIFDARADIFAPCALGGVLNAATIPRLQADIVVGAANNQLARSRDAKLLHERGIIHVPDYLASAGGIINGCRELAGWSESEAVARVDAIGETVREILILAERAGVTPTQTADLMVERRLAEVRGARGTAVGV